MKNSKQYSQAVGKLYRSLKRKGPKVKKVQYEDIIESLIHALVLEHMTDTAANTAFRKFSEYFVDFNDMRVSRAEEIIEMLGEDCESTRKISANIVSVMALIFRKYNTINLDSLNKAGKKQAKAILEKFDGVSKFCVDYCMLTALDGHAIPLTENMTAFMKENSLLDPEANPEEIEGFLTHQIPAKNAYEFYILIRKHCESQHGSKKTAKSKAAADKIIEQPKQSAEPTKETEQKGKDSEDGQ